MVFVTLLDLQLPEKLILVSTHILLQDPIGVASTKAFSCQIGLLLLMALYLGKLNTIDNTRYDRILNELFHLPKNIEKVLSSNNTVEKYL